MRCVFIIVVFLAVVSACGALSRRLPETPGMVPAREGGLEKRMDALARALGRQGFAEVETVELGQIHPDAPETREVRITEQARLVAVALGEPKSPGSWTDLNLRISDASHHTVIQDDTPGARAAVEWVARPDEAYSLDLGASRTTTCLVRIFASSELNTSASLNELFDADPVPRRTWSDLAGQLGTLGFSAVGQPTSWRAGAGDQRVLLLDLEKDDCAITVASGSPGVDRVTLRLYGPRGLLAADLEGRPHAAAMVCAEEEMRLRGAVTIAAGYGLISSGFFTASREANFDLAGPPLARKDRYLTLESAAAHQVRALETRGYAPVRTLARLPLEAGERVSVPLAVQGGECVALSTATAPSLSEVDLELFEDGRKIAADRRVGSDAELGVCASRESTYQIDVIALKGDGEARLIAGYSLTDLPSRTPGAGLDFLVQEAEMGFAAASLRPTSVDALEWTGDANAHLRIVLTEGRCYGAAVVSTARLARVSLTDPAGTDGSTWRGDASTALLTLCPGQTRTYTLEVVADGASADDPLYLALFDSGEESSRPDF